MNRNDHHSHKRYAQPRKSSDFRSSLLILCGILFLVQAPLRCQVPPRSTQSYLIADYASKDTAFLNEKCRQAGLDLGLPVVANRIPTSSELVAPKPSEHLLKQGALRLQLPMDEKQDEFAVYRSELFDQPSSLNVLQIDNELITYRTVEASGNIHLLYHCTRGAFGTKRAAHAKDAVIYKLWDTPERTLLPDAELQGQMAQAEAKRLAETEVPLLIFNDLKSYAYNEQGDSAIARFLDTMHKYNPEKLLQGDLLTPASWHYLSRINESQYWNETMRIKMAETLTEKQDFYAKHQMAWMIGNFQIRTAGEYRKATTLEELEWFLSKAAAFDAGFGLEFSPEAMRRHGLTDTMLNAVNAWESSRLSGAFSETQKEDLKDPFGNWHLEKEADTLCRLYPQYISRQYFCSFEYDRWDWDNPYTTCFALRITVEGKGSISHPTLITPNGTVHFPCTLNAGQMLVYDYDGTAFITDMNYNKIADLVPEGVFTLDEGSSEVSFNCIVKPEKKKTPVVTVRYFTRGESIPIPSHK